jgi:hypothetical protein
MKSMKNKAQPKNTKGSKPQGVKKNKQIQKPKMNPILRDKKLLKEIGMKNSEDSSRDAFFVEGLVTAEPKEDEIQEDPIVIAEQHTTVEPDLPGLSFWSPCTANATEKLTTSQSALNSNSMGLEMYGWGDKWSDTKITCRCISCEYKNAIPNMKGCKFAILVDLDNIGLDMFLQATAKKDFLNDGFLWCFYGGGYRKHLEKKYLPVFDALDKNDKSTTDELLGTVFEKYKLENHLRFSICGWKDQSADKAILKTLSLFVE